VLSGLHRVKLPVSNVTRSRDWYTGVLGLTTEIEFVEDGVLMGVGLAHEGMPAGIALRHDPERAKAMSGFDALALLVPTREEVHAWKARLDDAGVPHGGIITGHRGGAVLVGLRDPDAIEIRLYAD
jgi:catechol 2,3-dioxygenase-like lactoylglutathione lyase family enzyme